ncbi:MAG: DUF2235 domain-containing protein [Pseudomonadota bacterium]|jgi:uncharacterized protein (DUF2235 family)|nr:MAG: hypothetical protein DIU62_00710 [Pseudomonadota bacterium]
MPRNIVVCCDGTANQFAVDRTNVVKLLYTLEHDPDTQVIYYHPGIGTMEAVGAVTKIGRRVTKLLGKAIGYGLETDIRDAYVFLMHNFQPCDRVYMFGFSRGAYTVRAVASLLHMYGLIQPGNEPLVPYAIRMMMAARKLQDRSAAGGNGKANEYFQLADDFKDHFSIRNCKPHFVGIWDTVSSVGWIENPLRLPWTANAPNIQVGRHAIAIDERRAFFRTNLWRPGKNGGPKDIKQVWFPGVHCDVGGGYPEDESGLSKLALEWMLREATAHGLRVNPARLGHVLGRTGRNAKPDPDGRMHESLKGAWHLAEFVPKRHYDWQKKKERRRMNLYRRRTIPDGALIHRSVFLREGGRYAKRLKLPPNYVIED